MVDRFWSKVGASNLNGCEEWMGARQPKGYGIVQLDGTAQLAHRVVWTLVNGPIPDGLCVLHRCDNPPCVNPVHLWLGTQADNISDLWHKGRGNPGPGAMAAGEKQRAKTHCPRGHAYDESNTYHGSRGDRRCRTCNRDDARRRVERS